MKKVKDNRLIIVLILSIVILFIVFVIAIWKMGLLTFSGNDSSVKIIAATVTLLGALFASLITLVGLILKHSIDLRSIVILEQSELREKDAERRLKIEAAIQSMGLLSTSTGGDVPGIQKAGVILSLGNLGMFPIAIALTEKMLQDSSIDLGTVCWLVNRAIIDGDETSKEQAVYLISDHTDKMLLQNGSAVFPVILSKQSTIKTLPESAKRSCVWLIVDLITSRSYEEWNGSILIVLIESLFYIWKNEKIEDIRIDSGVALLKMISNYPLDSILYFANKSVKEFCEELKEYSNYSIYGNHYNGSIRMERLTNWAAKTEKI